MPLGISVGQPVFAGGVIGVSYARVCHNADRVTAFDAVSGARRWERTISTPFLDPYVPSIAAADGAIAFVDGSNVVAVDSSSGVQRWATQVASASNASGGFGVFASGGHFTLVSAFDPERGNVPPAVFALDTRDGSVAWTTTLPGNQVLEFEATTRSLFLIVSLGTPTENLHLLIVDATSGAVVSDEGVSVSVLSRHQPASPDAVTPKPLVADAGSAIAVAGVGVLEPVTARVLRAGRNGAAGAGPAMFYTVGPGTLVASDATSGEQRWQVATASPELLAADAQHVVVADSAYSLTAYDTADGRQLWSGTGDYRKGLLTFANVGLALAGERLAYATPGDSNRCVRRND